MNMDPNTEMTLRAAVDGRDLGRAKLPDPVEVTRTEAEALATWARAFSGACLTDIEVHVSDIRPSSALMVLSDLPKTLASRLRPSFIEARRHGFGLRLMRDDPEQPYRVSIIRRSLDVPLLTVPLRSMNAFLDALGFLSMRTDETPEGETRISLDMFAERLGSRGDQCMYAGVAHYREYCQRIIEYGRANGAKEILWGPERRGAVPPPDAA